MNFPLLALPIDIRRVALPLRADMIRATVPESAFGAYCIYRGGTAVYVGRSDYCVRARLLAHAASRLGTHFTWQRTTHERGAFVLECLWYHQIIETGHALNLVHPARSLAKGGTSCPICDKALRIAVRDVLHKLKMGL